MKIGIITLPFHTNYGGLLQAYALQVVLKAQGHEVESIDRIIGAPIPLYKRLPVYTYRMIRKYLCGDKKRQIKAEKIYRRVQAIKGPLITPFIEKYIKRIRVSSYSDIPADRYDAIVVGSDQVWRPRYFGKIEDAYLSFAKNYNIKRIAYAVSFGTDKWEYSEKKTLECKELIKKFDFVSTREKSGTELCEKHLGVKADWVVDPTMLVQRSVYDEIASSVPVRKGFVFAYILDNIVKTRPIIEHVASDLNAEMVEFSSNSVEPDEPKPSVEQWLANFRDAEVVVTDSFHACVFSVLYSKPFIVINNKSRGVSRILSLFEILGCKGSVVDIEDYSIDALPINRIDVSVVEEVRKSSLAKLLKAIG